MAEFGQAACGLTSFALRHIVTHKEQSKLKNIQQKTAPLPRRFRQRTTLALILIAISTLIAVIWALSDIGKIDEHWGKLALIFFTWLAVVLTVWALSRPKE